MSFVASGGASLYYNKPLMCNGANLVFERTTYQEVQSEMRGKNMASGDDMFLMLAIKNRFPNAIRFLKSEEAIVYTSPQTTLTSLFNQRKRWASKGLYYKDAYINFVSIVVFMTHFCLLITACISFFNPSVMLLFFGLFLSKAIVDFIFLREVNSFFNNKKSLQSFLFVELLNIIFINLIALLSQTKKYSWKGRQIKD